MMCSAFNVQVSATNPTDRSRSLFDITVVAVDEEQAMNDVLRYPSADFWQWQVQQVTEVSLEAVA